MGSCGNCGTSTGLPKGCKNHGTCGTDGCNKLAVFDWLANIQTSIIDNEPLYYEVRFKNDRKSFYTTDLPVKFHIGDVVAVDAKPGIDVGVVTLSGHLAKIQMRKKMSKKDTVGKIIRKATQRDIDTWKKFREKEHEAMLDARRIAKSLGLEMKICDVEYQGDGTKLTFYYTAEGRVDFRQLIKDYAAHFRTKIDMRQIGYRQESAKVGGIGSCGRELCCSTWLTDFRSVNTAAARYQQLAINPQKLAGQCGKLKCCLNFELDSYLDALQDFPNQQTILQTEKGAASVIKIDVFRKKMWFSYKENSMVWYDFHIDKVKEFIQLNRKNVVLPPLEELHLEKISKTPKDIIQENSLNRFEKRSQERNTSNSDRGFSNKPKLNKNKKK